MEKIESTDVINEYIKLRIDQTQEYINIQLFHKMLHGQHKLLGDVYCTKNCS